VVFPNVKVNTWPKFSEINMSKRKYSVEEAVQLIFESDYDESGVSGDSTNESDDDLPSSLVHGDDIQLPRAVRDSKFDDHNTDISQVNYTHPATFVFFYNFIET